MFSKFIQRTFKIIFQNQNIKPVRTERERALRVRVECERTVKKDELEYSKYIKFAFLSCLFLNVNATSVLKEQEEKDFIESFVGNCDIASQHARYTRSYHPYLLAKTRQSFLDLEKYFCDSGFDVKGRLVVAGYQEAAIPGIYPSFSKSIIDDEADFRNITGLSFAPANIFGFMTGFLLKDVSWMYQKIKMDVEPVFEHVLSDRVDLFEDQLALFQKEAFGQDFDFVVDARNKIEKTLFTGDPKKTIKRLIDFWTSIYAGVLKNSYNEIVATQDILFSIDYARYALESEVPLRKFFVGPDITYPIEVLSFQKQEATQGAQTFVKRFQSFLNPIDNQSTAYVFCSFVDGVGKSTLLGNLQNWAKFGSDFDKYERVDNSSSQKGVLYNLKDQVYIMDLPAQISHFLSKPDGFVYVDVETVKEFSDYEKEEVQKYVSDNSTGLIEGFADRIAYAQEEPDISLVESNPELFYMWNLDLLNIESPDWVPVSYGERHFLFNKKNFKLRIFVPLEKAHSCGLKVVDPEQIIFKGISIPMAFDSFLADLVEQLRGEGIEKVVFVDFMGMYPRSSRENVRMNFILQQLKSLMRDAFTEKTSLFRPFVNRYQELCMMLEYQKNDFIKSLALETAFRKSMSDFVTENTASTLTPFNVVEFKSLFAEKLNLLLKQQEKELLEKINNRVEHEHEQLKQLCAFDRSYHSLVRFSFDPLIVFSQYLAQFFEGQISDSYFNELWRGFGYLFGNSLDSFLVENEDFVKTVRLNKFCRDQRELAPCICQLRANWYAACSNILSWKKGRSGSWEAPSISFNVIPMGVMVADKNHVKIVQKELEQCEGGDLKKLGKFNIASFLGEDRRWGEFASASHCLDWRTQDTYSGVFAFGYQSGVVGNKRNVVTRLVHQYQREMQDRDYPDACITTSELYRRMQKYDLWSMISLEGLNFSGAAFGGQRSVGFDRDALRLFVRTIATLEMILKDINSSIIVRKGNKDDFIAAVLLLEKITLPLFFGIKSSLPLFQDYSVVKPVISYEYLA